MIAFIFIIKGEPTPEELPKPVHDKLFMRSLDGVSTSDFESTRKRPYAIMIDNSYDARPVQGLDRAVLVYEALAEGFITRILAIFHPDEFPEEIGPVRSLRPYFINWGDEVNALFVHVGGSPKALDMMRTRDNINEFYNENFFWRDAAQEAPHNVYTSKTLLDEAVSVREYATTTIYKKWHYDTDVIPPSPAVHEITIDFSVPKYEVSWHYDDISNRYNRQLHNTPEDVQADNVIVQIIPARVIDELLRRKLDIVGEGRVWVFTRGSMTAGLWHKKDENTRTVFLDNNGNTIPLSPGTTWVEIIDDKEKLSF